MVATVAMDPDLRSLVAQARRAAQKRGQTLTTAHLLLAALQARDPMGRLLEKRGLFEGRMLKVLGELEEEPATALDFTLEEAVRLAGGRGERFASSLHWLLAVTSKPRTSAHRCVERSGLIPGMVRAELEELLGAAPVTPRSPGGARAKSAISKHGRSANRIASTARRVIPPKRISRPKIETQAKVAAPDAASVLRESSIEIPQPKGGAVPASSLDPLKFPLLTAIGRNLTDLARAGRLDPVIGRDTEIETLLDVLSRRRANNPVLVGPAGVGKTAIVEGLASLLARGGKAMRDWEDRCVIETSGGALVSGTGVRGALGERMRQLREEVLRAEGQVLVFIDEIHTIVGGGDSPDDLGHELKAALARGEFPCIGATTETEFYRHFAKDAALARRFSAVQVNEPAPDVALKIVQGVLPRYEAHHVVAYAPEAVRASVDLSVRYLSDRQLPDKALALLDQAGARVRRRGKDIVDFEAVASAVAEQAKVPLERLMQRDADKLLRLEEHINEHVVGQDPAVRAVAEVLRKSAAGLGRPGPMATLLFLGPTGVGKTETAKVLADALFPERGFTRLDMSDFSEAHSVARLVGSPPGYVGHEEGGYLTEAVRRRPYQLILLDEIEKAHRDVLLALLPVLDEGRMTDSKGRTVDFSHTLLCLTSNLGADASARPSRIGFDDASANDARREIALASARAGLAPELWNRIDEPLYFAPLERAHVVEIARRMLASIAGRLEKEHSLTLEIDDSVYDALMAAGGYDAALGARPMRRVVGRVIESPLAAQLLGRDIRRGRAVRLRGKGDSVVIEVSDRAS